MKIYTKNGDQGLTSLVDGSKVKKSNLRLHTYGTVDELNCHIGVLVTSLQEHSDFSEDVSTLFEIQNWLFCLGSQLACSDESLSKQLPSINMEQTLKLEQAIDHMEKDLPELKNFILPGGDAAACQAHICRTVTRRAERSVSELNESIALDYPALPFLNRLSDYFFVLSRAINHRLNIKNVEWAP